MGSHTNDTIIPGQPVGTRYMKEGEILVHSRVKYTPHFAEGGPYQSLRTSTCGLQDLLSVEILPGREGDDSVCVVRPRVFAMATLFGGAGP